MLPHSQDGQLHIPVTLTTLAGTLQVLLHSLHPRLQPPHCAYNALHAQATITNEATAITIWPQPRGRCLLSNSFKTLYLTRVRLATAVPSDHPPTFTFADDVLNVPSPRLSPTLQPLT